MLRVALSIVGLAAMGYAALSLLDPVGPGFPDGYISPYDRATAIWATSLVVALLLAGIFTLVAAAMRKLRRGIAGAIVILIFAGVLQLLDTCPRLDWCGFNLERLTGIPADDGQGG